MMRQATVPVGDDEDEDDDQHTEADILALQAAMDYQKEDHAHLEEP